MKHLILSADGDRMVYLVPDDVADHTGKYVRLFYNWMKESKQAKHLRRKMGSGIGYCFNEQDFVDWLNHHKFRDTPCVFVENLGFINPLRFPDEYKDCPWFNF